MEKLDNYNARFVFSISQDVRSQLEFISANHECSSAAILRKLIKEEYNRLMQEQETRNVNNQ